VLSVVVGAWWFDHRDPLRPAWASSMVGAVLMLGALVELQRMGGTAPGPRSLGRIAGVAWLAAHALASLLPNHGTRRLADALTVLSLLACLVVLLQLARGPGPAGRRLAGSLWFQLPYVGGVACLVRLGLGGSLDFVVALVLVSKASDTGAYFTGMTLGRHKLAPAISPGKTWEGVAGGLVLAAAAGAWLLPGQLVRAAGAGLGEASVPDDALLGAIMGVTLGTLAVLADLAESLLKRSCGVKDSSRLLGPAGGFLDLADTLLVVGPIAVAYSAAVG
jgi:phosphatidate cytidylyltransferase